MLPVQFQLLFLCALSAAVLMTGIIVGRWSRKAQHPIIYSGVVGMLVGSFGILLHSIYLTISMLRNL